MKVLDKNIALGRFHNAWAICQVWDKEDTWRKLGTEAMRKTTLSSPYASFATWATWAWSGPWRSSRTLRTGSCSPAT